MSFVGRGCPFLIGSRYHCNPNSLLHFTGTGSNHYYETAPRNIFLSTFKRRDLEGSGQYAQVGPPESRASSICETNLDSVMFRNMLQTPDVSVEYDMPSVVSPVTSSPLTSPTRNKNDTLPLAPIPRSNTYEKPEDVTTPTESGGMVGGRVEGVELREGSHRRRRQLETTATVYEIPLDATGAMDSLDLATPPQRQVSGAYDTPIDAMITAEAIAMPTHRHEESWPAQEDLSQKRLINSDSASSTESEAMPMREREGPVNTSTGIQRPLLFTTGVESSCSLGAMEGDGGVCTIDEDGEYIRMASALIYVNRKAQHNLTS